MHDPTRMTKRVERLALIGSIELRCSIDCSRLRLQDFAIKEFTFTAQAPQTALPFTDLTTAAGDSPFIDDVIVTGPEVSGSGP